MAIPFDLEKLQTEYDERGLLIIDTGLSDDVLEGAKRDMQNYFGPQRVEPEGVPYADHNRIQDAWHISQNVRDIARSQNVLDLLQGLYGRTVLPFQTLNFETGTEQAVHADSIHFNSEPFGAMCGVWVALEDIGPDQGPLVYYPGSHKLPEINFPDLGLPASADYYGQYLEGLQKLIKEHEFEPEYGLIKKGQAVVWSANILHGGSKQNDYSLSRRSQVTHYYVADIRYWRPTLSEHERHYFEPHWIRAADDPEPSIASQLVPRSLAFYRRIKAGIRRRLNR